MRSPPKSNGRKVLVPPARSGRTQTIGTCPKSEKSSEDALKASQSEVKVHLRLTKDNTTKALDTPPIKLAAKTSVLDTPLRESATKMLSPRSSQKTMPTCSTLPRSSPAKTIISHSGISPRSDQKKMSVGAHFLRCSSDKIKQASIQEAVTRRVLRRKTLLGRRGSFSASVRRTTHMRAQEFSWRTDANLLRSDQARLHTALQCSSISLISAESPSAASALFANPHKLEMFFKCFFHFIP